MIPGNILSTTLMTADWKLNKSDDLFTPLSGYELGGELLNISGNSLDSFIWKYYYEAGKVILRREDLTELHIVDTIGSITELSVTFDQQMSPYYTFVQGFDTYLKYYNATTQTYNTIDLGRGLASPKVVLDYKVQNSAASDVIIFYMKDSITLCARAQRDRFLTEYTLKTTEPSRIVRVGMNKNNRLQFLMEQVF